MTHVTLLHSPHRELSGAYFTMWRSHVLPCEKLTWSARQGPWSRSWTWSAALIPWWPSWVWSVAKTLEKTHDRFRQIQTVRSKAKHLSITNIDVVLENSFWLKSNQRLTVSINENQHMLTAKLLQFVSYADGPMWVSKWTCWRTF